MYRVIYADPPWRCSDQGTRLSPAYAGKQRKRARYPTMSLDAIKALRVAQYTAETSVLFLWRLASMPQEALDVAQAWGFTVKSEIVWCKITQAGTPRLGGGHYVRCAHETCLVATRGRAAALRKDRTIPSWFMAPRSEHSAKPVEIYNIIERLFDGPYLELFATHRRREGWSSWGPKCGLEVKGVLL